MFPGETVLSQKELGYEPDKHVSPFRVMKSEGTGLFYIGTTFVSCGDRKCSSCGEEEYPRENYEAGKDLDYNSRETEYMEKREDADRALAEYLLTNELPGMRW